jgi:flagellar hook-associated protein 3 FlgL
MTISGIQNGYFQTQVVNTMESSLAQLETELGTGEASQNYAGIADNRGLAISLQSQISQLNNYNNVIGTVGVRLSSAQQALTAISTSTNQVQQSLINSQFTLDQNGQTPDQTTAAGQLGEIVDALNTQVGDTYIFSGTATNTPAVASANEILNGNGAQAGLRR